MTYLLNKNHHTNKALSFIFLLVFSQLAFAQQAFWTDVEESSLDFFSSTRQIKPQKSRALSLNIDSFKKELALAPLENPNDAIEITLPLPDGSYLPFRIYETHIMEQALRTKYSELKTYAGSCKTNPRISVFMDITYKGFHAMIINGDKMIYIDPYASNTTNYYICYYKSDLINNNTLSCLVSDEKTISASLNQQKITDNTSGPELRTYRLALGATAEYSTFQGGTKAGALSAMVTSMNRVNGIYQKEVAIKMVLVGNTDTLIFLDASTDPYSNGSAGTMLGENQIITDSLIGFSNYDIGHVFGVGSGGVANLGSVCGSYKAYGVTGSSSPVGDPFDVDYVAHEIGHQFSGSHSFNSTYGSCNGNGYWLTAVEPGSGTTIMAYAGICGSDDIQAHSDPYFHTISFDEIIEFSHIDDGNTCPTINTTGNNAPAVTVSGDYTIPFKTPFELTGTATDADNDALTYSWEEVDFGAFGPWNNPTGYAPLFRCFAPTASPTRTFPKLSSLISGLQSKGELLPTYARPMKFRLVARDNQILTGGVSYSPIVTINVINTTTPFKVSYPSTTGILWGVGLDYTVTWDVSSTDLSPISCSDVKISLSLDGGNTYPIVLAASTPNDGSELITIPNNATTNARIKVEAIGNVFFDISDKNFTITTNISVAELSQFSNALEVYPNPTQGDVTINYNTTDDLQLTVYNVIGESVLNMIFTKTIDIRTSELANGMYTFVFLNKKTGERASKKVIVN